MKDAITYLNDLNIDTTNHNRAVQSAGLLAFDEDTYREVISDLTGTDTKVEDDFTKYTFMYVVDQIMTKGTPDFESAYNKAKQLVKQRPWTLAKPEYTSSYTPKSTTDALGNPKQKKGAKKEAAKKFWKENQGKFTTRKQWIEALMEHVGLTKAGASTYHYNLKKGIY